MVIETFELYLASAEDSRHFVPLTCRRSEVITRARSEMERLEAESCQVEQFGETLIKLDRSR